MTTREIVELTKKNIEDLIIEDEELYDTKLDFILIEPDTKDTISIISDEQEKIIEFTPYTKDMKNGYFQIPDWDYNFDEYLFQNLENGYEIGYMSDDTHYNVWSSIEELYPEDINYKNGVQLYLQYCANNGITKDYLSKKINLDVPDIMKYFNVKELDKTMMSRVYVIGADDTIDNRQKSLSQEERDILAKYRLNGEDKFRYMMLDRFYLDCKYYLGNGNRNSKHLWAKNPKEHIKIMKALYNSLPIPPEWITIEEINNLERKFEMGKNVEDLMKNDKVQNQLALYYLLEYGKQTLNDNGKLSSIKEKIKKKIAGKILS